MELVHFLDWFAPSIHTGTIFLELAVLYAICAILYRLNIHPLASIPGPLLHRISGWPDALDHFSGDRHIRILHYHDLYGPVVRLSPNLVSFNTAEAVQAIYLSGRANVEKGWWYNFVYAVEQNWTVFSSIDKNMHAKKRRLMSHAFSDNAVRGAEELIVKNISQWTDIFDKQIDQSTGKDGWSTAINMSSWSNYLALDILGDLCFGKPFQVLTSDAFRFVLDLIPAFSGMLYSLGNTPIKRLLAPLMRSKLMEIVGGESHRQNLKFIGWAHKTMEERVKGDAGKDLAGRRDFVHYLLRGKDRESGDTISLDELKGDSIVLIVAGTDTSSTALSATFFYLVHNKHILDRLTRDVRSTFDDVEEIRTGPKLSSLTYLRACIDEALRMSPPVAGILTRKVLAGGLDVHGYHLPEGTELGVSAYAIHHNEEYFPEPFSFKPERWRVNDAAGVTEENVALAQSAFCPFSVGSRGCIGKSLAYVELSLAIATALFLYDLRQAPSERTGGGDPALQWGRRRRGEYQLADRFIAVRDGPLLELKRAQGP
ncbi:hypothetical protein CLAIMM_03671 [Cladophialophora immunda]|nr:hypothetical protein CLAIMM_03671 [Cladophialophora immunda]